MFDSLYNYSLCWYELPLNVWQLLTPHLKGEKQQGMPYCAVHMCWMWNIVTSLKVMSAWKPILHRQQSLCRLYMQVVLAMPLSFWVFFGHDFEKFLILCLHALMIFGHLRAEIIWKIQISHTITLFWWEKYVSLAVYLSSSASLSVCTLVLGRQAY